LLFCLLSSLCSLCLCGESRALDPELTTPYKVQVVLRVAPNRALTPIFKEQLRRDLQQGLQAALGAMGEVEVIDPAEVPADKQEPLWKEVAAKGLQAGLDKASQAAAPVKTHFVHVDYVDGQYEIQARQYDGLTGTASPAVRRERTPDREFVARTAALLVDRDFGVVGTVTGADDKAVRVAFKGGGLKVPLDRWVKKGDVFALVQVSPDGRTARLPWTLLQADEAPGEDGTCPCKLWPPQQRPLTASGAEYRCLKLGTVKAPVRLRVLEVAKQGPPKAPREPVIIYVSRQGFDDGTRIQGVSDGDGFYATDKEEKPLYDGVAFVTILSGGQVRARVPVALVDEQTIRLPIRPADESPRALWQAALWERDLIREQLKLNELFKSLNEDIGPGKGAERREAALKRARGELEKLDDNIRRYRREQGELQPAKPKPGEKPPDLSGGIARLQDLDNGRKELAGWVASLEKLLKEQGAGEGQEVLAAFEQARNFEKQADYGKAIDLYEKVLAKTKEPKLEQRLEKLKEAWKPKSDEHAKARSFIYDTWPKLEPRAVTKERVKEAQAALAVCRKVKDPLGPRKLLAVASLHSKQLSQQLKELQPTIDTVDADRRLAEELTAVLEPLNNQLIKDARDAVEQTPVP
jgi:hypothetical protein